MLVAVPLFAQNCPNPRIRVHIEKGHPTPEPSPDKALVFVVPNDLFMFSPSLHVDGTFVGGNKNHTYFFVELKPGEHTLCTTASRSGLKPATADHLTVTFEAGKVYYIEQTQESTYSGDRMRLTLLRPEQGRAQVAAARFAKAEIKQ